jgi:hypothetical protein
MCRLLLGLIIFAFPAFGLLIPTATDTSAASATSDSFIYPGVSNNPVANVSDVVVYRNDTMVVEYSQLDYTTTLRMSMNCFINQTGAQTVDALAFDGDTGWVSEFGPCEFNWSPSKPIHTHILTAQPRRRHRPRPMGLF